MSAPFYRRLFALFYDCLLVLSLWIVVSLVIILCTQGRPISPDHPFYQAYRAILFAIVFGFFVGFWTYGGQTAGMRAWRLKMTTLNGKTPSSFRAGIRFLVMMITQVCGAVGWLWIFLDPEKQTLYDRVSGTKIILLPPKIK